jgi:glutathione S-transferase
VHQYFSRLLERPSVAAHLAEARQPYTAITAAAPGSPQWIVRQYRYHPTARLLHDWRRDMCHELVGPVTIRAVQLAYRGDDLPTITAKVADEFHTPRDVVAADLHDLFAHLAPKTALPGEVLDEHHTLAVAG